tara:strand:- start:4550 stop:4783 length:234 start_codon:yes stop_codon:yes gene_type:complete
MSTRYDSLDPKNVNTPKVSKPVFSNQDTRLLRECITFYLNKNDFMLESNTSAGFVPSENNVKKKTDLVNLIHRLGRI